MAAVDVNVEETHENDKRTYQMVVQIHMSWLITDFLHYFNDYYYYWWSSQ